MGRLVKFSVVDGNGAGVGGQVVVAGDVSLTTIASGLAQALLDEGNTVITINGVRAYDGPSGDLKPTEVFTTAGQRV